MRAQTSEDPRTQHLCLVCGHERRSHAPFCRDCYKRCSKFIAADIRGDDSPQYLGGTR